jgi:hypothetical protein
LGEGVFESAAELPMQRTKIRDTRIGARFMWEYDQ